MQRAIEIIRTEHRAIAAVLLALKAFVDGMEQGQQVGFGGRPVLEVEDGPVHAGPAEQFGRQGRGEIGERADERVTAEDPLSEVGHRR